MAEGSLSFASNPRPRLAVIGAGTMGRGIAEVAIRSGLRTALFDVSGEALRSAAAQIENGLRRPGQDDLRDRLSLLELTTSLTGAVSAADVVIEAVTEKLDLKLAVLRDVTQSAAAETLICSNTSTISITRLAESVAVPERLVGMHFFNPVPRMQLVEVIRGERTAEDAVQSATALAQRMGKDPIVVKDSPGFASSRLGIVLGNEAMRMVEQGVASPQDIDTAMRLGYNHPMGPLELADLIGLDARLNNAQSVFEALGQEQFRPPEILRRLVDAGRLGRKSGHGFYEYHSAGRLKPRT